MIRKCTEDNRGELYRFLREEEAMNIFLLGDIEHYGFGEDFQEVWADFGENGRVQGVLLRYDRNYLFYGQENCDYPAFAGIVRSGPEWDMLNVKTEMAERFSGLLELRERKDMIFAKLQAGEGTALPCPDGPDPIKASEKDVDALLRLRYRITEFHTSSSAGESMVRNFRSGAMRTYFLEENGEAVASASTTAEYSGGAMVVAVCTDPDHRNKGYASRCMSKLCHEVSAEGKTLCLFYENPVAGAIYKRLGFRDIGKWSLCYA